VTATALAPMAGSASMRADLKVTEELAARALAADPADPTLAGFCRAGVGMALFMAGDTAAALPPFAEGIAALSRLPNAEPISIRALWPLIQAARGDRRATATLDEVRRLGVQAFRLNRGLIAFAQAVLEGCSGRPGRADAIVTGHATAFVNCEAWADLARFIAAPQAHRPRHRHRYHRGRARREAPGRPPQPPPEPGPPAAPQTGSPERTIGDILALLAGADDEATA
jgi:hypothetical protein